MARYARESVIECWDELQPLFRLHDAEIPIIKGGFEADKNLVAQWVQNGNARFYTVRFDGMIVGYAGYLTSPEVMKKGQWGADSVLLFLHPEYRHLGYGNNLLSYAEADLAMECDKVNYSIPVSEPGLHAMLFNRGTELVEYGFSKELR